MDNRMMDELAYRRMKRQQDRIREILGRFTRADDAGKSDLDFVRTVMERFEEDRMAPIVDPNE